jgi:hypothetical protein
MDAQEERATQIEKVITVSNHTPGIPLRHPWTSTQKLYLYIGPIRPLCEKKIKKMGFKRFRAQRRSGLWGRER